MAGEYHTSIKELPVEMRPREKMLARGEEYLTEAELLAILLGSGTRKLSAIELAQHLLQKYEGLRLFKTLTIQEMLEFEGIGLAKAARIRAAAELGRRLALTSNQQQQIKSPEDVKNYVMEDMRYYDREHFKCLYLNRKNQVISLETISIGGLANALVHPREVFKPAVKRSAAAVILIHNHPSGDPTPSKEDINITKRLIESGKLLGIEVLDHIIIGDGRYFSLKAGNVI
ncbi:MAG: DNA repair protein RadC [Syntrophomonadaceae bacterium]|jgi:DNA repair protein RadC|nr:DNA repair protein RadC [Syntrophomonadaceae bacterium]